MARELIITIKANGAQAQQELRQTEQQIDKVEQASGNADKTMSAWGENSKRAVLALGAAFAAANIGEHLQKAVDAASNIADVSQKVGISAEAVQRLGFVAEQTGSTMDAVGDAIIRMGANIIKSNGKDGVAKAIEDLGLNLDKLKQMKPEDAFYAITGALKDLPEGMRQSNDAVAIFGRGAGQILPAIKAGFKEVGDQAPVMTNAVVDAGDRVGDKWNELNKKFGNLQAEALIPFADWFQKHLPDSVQVGAAGIYTFFPSLEQLVIALLAVGGPTGAMSILTGAGAALVTFFTVTMPGAITAFISGAGAFLVTFFLETLPAAFGAIIAFLGPQGLIALGLIALGLIWYKWGDDITAIVKKVYAAVKEWLVDKFKEVVGWIGEQVNKISGFFGDMYDKVVGHSYVPDMVNEIGQHFGRLDTVMVNPAKIGTNIVNTVFQEMTTKVNDLVGKMFDKIGIDFSHFTSTTLPSFGAQVNEQSKSILGSVKDGLMSGLTSGIGDAVSGLIQSGVGALVNAARGGEEGVLVNPRRDAFLSQFGDPSDKGDNGAGHNLAALLTGFGAGGGGGTLFGNLQHAESMVAFQAAADNIIRFLKDHGVESVRGFAQGTRGLVDFGPESLVKLHGREEVRTEAQVNAERSGLDSLAVEMRGFARQVMQYQRDMARQMAVAQVDANALRVR